MVNTSSSTKQSQLLLALSMKKYENGNICYLAILNQLRKNNCLKKNLFYSEKQKVKFATEILFNYLLNVLLLAG